MRHLPGQKWLFATTALIGISIIQSSFAADTTITTGTTVGQQSIGDGDTLIIEPGATINDAAAGVIDTVDGSTITIKSEGTITSTADSAIDNSDSTLHLTNSGSISGFFDGIDTLNIGMLSNSGDIVGQFDGIYAAGDTKSFINSGSITGVAFTGLLGDGTLSYLNNTGLITGGSDGVAYRVVTLVENGGTISGDFTGLLSDEIGSVFNTGLITSSFGIGVEGLSSIGSVNNMGTISGDLVGIQSGGVFGSFTNSGLVTGVNGAGILSLGRLGTVDNSGTVSGLIFGIGAEDIGSIFNSGLITGEDGVYSNTNLAGLTNNGTISGSFFSGVSVQNTVGTITNNGAITGLDNGVDVGDLNSLVNTGSITGTDTDGVLVGGTLGSLANYGSITGGVHAVDSRYITMLNNTGSLLGGEDGIFAQTITSLTNSGSITATANDGIHAETLINLTNTGSITGGDDGVDVDYITNFTNSSSITGGVRAVNSRDITMLNNTSSLLGGEDGIFAQTITSLTNSGSIIATANDGIHAETLINLTNTGSITGGDDGVDVDYITNFTNYGSITGQDEGIKSHIITMLTNNGTITGGTASDSSGIDADFGTIVNNGTIEGVVGIEFDRTNSSGGNAGNSSVTNNGTIRSTSGVSGVAIDYQGTGSDTLTLNNKSILVGSVNWDGIDDTLNLDMSLSAIIKFSTLPSTINYSSSFYHVKGTTVIQVDTGFIASVDDVVLLTSGNVNQTVFGRLASVGFNNLTNNSGQNYNDVASSGTRSAWNSNWAGYTQLETANNYKSDDTKALGSVFGLDWAGQTGTIYGVYSGLGLGHTNVGLGVPHEVTSETYYGGVYLQFSANNTQIDLDLSGGLMQLDSKRSIVNSSAINGLDIAAAKYDVKYFAPSIKVSKEIELESGYALMPALTAGYAGMMVNEFTETGSLADVSFGGRVIHQFSGRAELGLAVDWLSNNQIAYRVVPYAGVEGKTTSGDIDQVTGTIGSTTTTFNPGGDTNTSAVFAGFKMNAKITEASLFNGSLEAKYDNSKKLGISGKWGIAFKF